MTVLTITLEPPLADFIDDLVATGRYESAEDAVTGALLKLQSEVAFETPEYMAWLKGEVQKGLDDIAAGHVVDLDMDEIYREALARSGQS